MRQKIMSCNKEKILCEIENILLILFIFLAIFVRFYKLADIPYGMHVDEAGMGYDAWCLANYGVDRWLNQSPVYLINYGGGQSALYAYLCAALVKTVGRGSVSLLLMRLPGAVISTVAYAAGIYMIWKSMNKHWAVIGAFLLAIMPYFTMQGRFALDCNLLVNMLTISVFLLIVALEQRKMIHFVITGVAWGLTFYTYALSYIPNTIILLIVCACLLWEDKGLWKKLLVMLIPVVLFGIPLLLMLVVNQFGLEQINLPFMTIPALPNYRGGELYFGLESMIDNVSTVLKSIFMRDWLEYNAFSGYYTMYTISIPFIVLGFIEAYRYSVDNFVKKKLHPVQIWWLVFTVYFVFGLGLAEATVNRINGIYFAQFYLLIWGIRSVYLLLSRCRKLVAGVAVALVLALYLSNGYSFLSFYFEKYATAIYPQFLFMDTYEETLAFLKEEGKLEGNTVYVDANDTYYCLSLKMDPYEFNRPGHEEKEYKNFVYTLPEEYVPGAVYIVRETDIAYIEMLEQYVTEKYREGMYICYY